MTGDKMNIWLIAIVAGVVLMFAMFGLMLMLDRKRGNIEYIIYRTFLGGQKIYKVRGMVDVKNDGSFMAEHVALTGGKRPIGKFHQKHMKDAGKGQWLMVLEEYDIGRFRPLEYRGHLKGKSEVVRRVPMLDEKGTIRRDAKGTPMFTESREIIDTGTLKGIKNDDVDWILQRKEKNRQLLLRKEERNKWWPVIAAGGIMIIAGVVLVMTAFYLNEMSAHFDTATNRLADFDQAKEDIKVIRGAIVNQSITDIFTGAPPGAG